MLSSSIADLPGIHHLLDLDGVQIPAVRAGDLLELGAILGEGHVESPLALRRPVQEELEPQCRLSGARRPFQQVDASPGKTSGQDVVEAPDTRLRAL